MSIIIIVLCLLLLITLISVFKANAFLSFLLTSILAGVLLGIPPERISDSVAKGIGDTMGSLTVIIVLGAMLGKLVAESGAAQKIAEVMVGAFGVKHLQWALTVTGFVVGIPLFYGVGFVLLVPLIFSIVYKYKLPAVYTGLPMLAALSVTHGFLPPHPSPTALVVQFNADMGLTLIYGLCVAIPVMVLAGPVFSKALKNVKSVSVTMFEQKDSAEYAVPGKANSFVTALLPVFLLIMMTVVPYFFAENNATAKSLFDFTGDPCIVMLTVLIVATCSLGLAQGRSIRSVMDIYAAAVKDVAMILLIIAGSGIFKQVMEDSEVSCELAAGLQHLPIHPLILGWLIAAVIRMCVGSATVAALTAAGVIMPLMVQTGVDPNMMVLSLGAGSLMFSHVNDAGFWMFKEYFNLSLKDTFKSWSVMETIVSVAGLIGVMILNSFIS